MRIIWFVRPSSLLTLYYDLIISFQDPNAGELNNGNLIMVIDKVLVYEDE